MVPSEDTPADSTAEQRKAKTDRCLTILCNWISPFALLVGIGMLAFGSVMLAERDFQDGTCAIATSSHAHCEKLESKGKYSSRTVWSPRFSQANITLQDRSVKECSKLQLSSTDTEGECNTKIQRTLSQSSLPCKVESSMFSNDHCWGDGAENDNDSDAVMATAVVLIVFGVLFMCFAWCQTYMVAKHCIQKGCSWPSTPAPGFFSA